MHLTAAWGWLGKFYHCMFSCCLQRELRCTTPRAAKCVWGAVLAPLSAITFMPMDTGSRRQTKSMQVIVLRILQHIEEDPGWQQVGLTATAPSASKEIG